MQDQPDPLAPTGYKICDGTGRYLAAILGYDGNTTSTEWTLDVDRALILPITKATTRLARDLDAALVLVR